MASISNSQASDLVVLMQLHAHLHFQDLELEEKLNLDDRISKVALQFLSEPIYVNPQDKLDEAKSLPKIQNHHVIELKLEDEQVVTINTHLKRVLMNMFVVYEREILKNLSQIKEHETEKHALIKGLDIDIKIQVEATHENFSLEETMRLINCTGQSPSCII